MNVNISKKNAEVLVGRDLLLSPLQQQRAVVGRVGAQRRQASHSRGKGSWVSPGQGRLPWEVRCALGS